MRSTTDHQRPPSSSNDLPTLQVTNWPLGQQPRFVFLAAIAIFAVGFLAAWVLQNNFTGIAAVAVLLMTTWRMWIPVRYEFDATGVHQVVWKRRSQMPWSRIARYEADPNGVLLLHQQDAYPLTALRGTYIYSPSDQEALLKLLEFYC